MTLATWRGYDARNPDERSDGFFVYPAHGENHSQGAKVNATRDIRVLREVWWAGGEDARADDWRVLTNGGASGLHCVEFESPDALNFLEREICPLPDTWTITRPSGALVMLFKSNPASDPTDLTFGSPILSARAWKRDSAALPGSIHRPSKERWRWDTFSFPTRVPLSPLPRAWLSLMPRKKRARFCVTENSE
jgi:hypothetical protein